VCGDYGHNARTCEKSPGPKPSETPEPIRPPRLPKAVAATDVPKLKAAVVNLVDALEAVDTQDRERVIQSALLILGGKNSG